MVSEVIVVAFRNAKMKGPHIGKGGTAKVRTYPVVKGMDQRKVKHGCAKNMSQSDKTKAVGHDESRTRVV